MARSVRTSVLAAMALGTSALVGCAAGDAGQSGPSACDGSAVACTCGDGGAQGTRACMADGGLGPCMCTGATMDAAVDAPAPLDVTSEPVARDVVDVRPDVPQMCGDELCTGTEDCQTCPVDCGRCATCDYAPSCTGASSVPTTSTRLGAFDNNSQALYSSDVTTVPNVEDTNCVVPQLRMRVRQILVNRIGVWPDPLEMYCVVHANDGLASEVMITPLQQGLRDGATLVFDPTTALFWGQNGLHTTFNNLTVTYQCFKVTNNSAYEHVFGAIQDGAVAAGGVAGPWGWAFGVGSIAAGLVGAAISTADGEELRLSVQQTIDARALLDLTNGRIWHIQQSGSGGGLNGTWDWTLEIEAWGCSQRRRSPG
jgi:hypothetical protein